MEATEVRELLDRFNEQDWERQTEGAFTTTKSFTEHVVEEGSFFPGSRVEADLDLTMRERLSGNREQDVTAFIVMGMMLGAALERDVPKDTEKEEQWRNGEFTLDDE